MERDPQSEEAVRGPFGRQPLHAVEQAPQRGTGGGAGYLVRQGIKPAGIGLQGEQPHQHVLRAIRAELEHGQGHPALFSPQRPVQLGRFSVSDRHGPAGQQVGRSAELLGKGLGRGQRDMRGGLPGTNPLKPEAQQAC